MTQGARPFFCQILHPLRFLDEFLSFRLSKMEGLKTGKDCWVPDIGPLCPGIWKHPETAPIPRVLEFFWPNAVATVAANTRLNGSLNCFGINLLCCKGLFVVLQVHPYQGVAVWQCQDLTDFKWIDKKICGVMSKCYQDCNTEGCPSSWFFFRKLAANILELCQLCPLLWTSLASCDLLWCWLGRWYLGLPHLT